MDIQSSLWISVWRCLGKDASDLFLRALLKGQVVNDEGLHTMLCEVEALLNCLLITKVSDDPKDIHALTLKHLLLTQSNQSLPPRVFSKADVYPKRRWGQVQYIYI